MRKIPLVCAALLSVGILGAALARADDPPAVAESPATQPAADAGGKSVAVCVSFKPYSALVSLTPDQAQKINAIHKKFLDEQRELVKRHDADCIAVLSDAQKSELKEQHEKDLAE